MFEIVALTIDNILSPSHHFITQVKNLFTDNYNPLHRFSDYDICWDTNTVFCSSIPVAELTLSAMVDVSTHLQETFSYTDATQTQYVNSKWPLYQDYTITQEAYNALHTPIERNLWRRTNTPIISSFSPDASLKSGDMFDHVSDLMDAQYQEAVDLGLADTVQKPLSHVSDDELVELVRAENNPDGFYFKVMAQRMSHHATPTVKLHYPEAFIASPSVIHDDIFFVHILQYQYWLWFIFITLIVFFFLSFTCVVRWCNVRTRPRRETRGVSRSKCGDFITAMVPLSWAGSIIVSESTDPIDYYDGFGTSEMVVGIRAYQWGWEYYYPQNMDINYGLRPNYSSFIGNSLKYNKASDGTTDGNSLWKFYQSNMTDSIVTPAHLLVLPNDNAKVLNHLNFDDIGTDTLKESQAFKKIRQSSKTFTTNLVMTPGTFVGKYNTLYDLYLRDTPAVTSSTYGNVRQHNLSATLASTNVNKVSLDSRSAVNFITKNLGVEQLKSSQESDVLGTNVYWTDEALISNNSTRLHVLNEFGKKQNRVLPLLDTPFYKHVMVEGKLEKEAQPGIMFNTGTYVPTTTTSFTNLTTVPYTTHTAFSNLVATNNSALTEVGPSNRTIRSVDGVSTLTPSVNFDPKYVLTTKSPNKASVDGFGATGFTDLEAIELNTDVTSRMLGNRAHMDLISAPALSNNPEGRFTDFELNKSKQVRYDLRPGEVVARFNTRKTNLTGKSRSTAPSHVYTGSDIGALDSLRKPYWSMYWGRSNPDLRVYSSLDAANIHRFFYLEEPTDYADYDFRNAQAAELFEDALWESSYSAYNHQSYMDIIANYNNPAYAPKLTQQPIDFFYPKHLKVKVSLEPSLEPYLRDVSNIGLAYANSVFFDDNPLYASTTATRNFAVFNSISGLDNAEEGTTAMKGLRFYETSSAKSGLVVTSHVPTGNSVASVLHTYKAEDGDYCWYTDKPVAYEGDNTSCPENIQFDDASTPVSSAYATENLLLRSSARNSILYYNALQKVFRSRYEEGRANVGPLNYAESSVRKPYISSGRANVEQLLGKNKTGFFNPIFFKPEQLGLFNELYQLNSTLNFQTFDFPFLLAEKSPAAKFFWLDWRSKWVWKEVQPAMTARLSLLAVPHTRENFDYNVDDNVELQKRDLYSLRLSRARKNYLTNWAFTPKLLLKSYVWFDQNTTLQTLFKNVQSGHQNIQMITYLLESLKVFWYMPYMYNNVNTRFTPSSSGITTFTHVENSYTMNPVSSYAVNLANLIDYLTKREYVYRQLNSVRSDTISVPKELTASPNNTLVRLFKTSYNFTDLPGLESEAFRANNGSVVSQLKNWNSLQTSSVIALNVEKALTEFFTTNSDPRAAANYSDTLLKSQYKPLKKGISNMLRLHATGTIAMPIEMRLQVLASSRDIIHSWAIPGAGIKIDCVPGYTSHRTTIFLVSGIYWGQCMEICGRFHHWMPIVVQFMKRDLFFLWCSHFISQPNRNAGWDINDRRHVNFIRLASFDKNTWAVEKA